MVITGVMTILNASAGQANGQESARLRQELQETRAAFETRIAELESRLQQLEAADSSTDTPSQANGRLTVIEDRLDRVQLDVSQQAASYRGGATAFNPQISVILSGSYANLSQDPEDYRLQGFIPSGEEIGPPPRSFNLGESELTLSANIDPLFYGEITLAVEAEDEITVEEAFVRSIALPGGLSAQFGRFFSAVGYVNSFHAHAWDFVNLPLVYEAMLGGQYATDGLRLSWLAPLDNYLEFGVELGNGRAFPGAEHSRNRLNATLAFASYGADIGDSASWKATLAYLAAEADGREYEESDSVNDDLVNPVRFSGDSDVWSLGGVYKWAPYGNSRDRHFKLQGEYFLREEDGMLSQDNARLGTGIFDYDSRQSGWYLQTVYKFRYAWRVGLRYDRLDSGDSDLKRIDGALLPADFPSLESYDPERTSLMLDFSPTEFSRLRLQVARDKSAPGSTDNQIILQYLMSLGTHGAHRF